MMFSIAGMISYKMLPSDRTKHYFANEKRKGISCKLVGAISMALLFALVESFLAGTSNHSFIWVYKWWGVLPVFITTYIPFFLASNSTICLKEFFAIPYNDSGFVGVSSLIAPSKYPTSCIDPITVIFFSPPSNIFLINV